jgi:hypothetical protein
MNTLELLLKQTPSNLNSLPEKWKFPGSPPCLNGQAVFTCQALSPAKYNEIQQAAADFSNGQVQGIDMGEVQMATVLAG